MRNLAVLFGVSCLRLCLGILGRGIVVFPLNGVGALHTCGIGSFDFDRRGSRAVEGLLHVFFASLPLLMVPILFF